MLRNFELRADGYHRIQMLTNINEEITDELNKLTLDTLRGRGQVLIFVNSRRSAQAASRQICKDVALILTEEEKIQLVQLAKEMEGSSYDSTKICRLLA